MAAIHWKRASWKTGSLAVFGVCQCLTSSAFTVNGYRQYQERPSSTRYSTSSAIYSCRKLITYFIHTSQAQVHSVQI
jgi:hypothetical protein